MRISDWSSDVCSSDLSSKRLRSGRLRRSFRISHRLISPPENPALTSRSAKPLKSSAEASDSSSAEDPIAAVNASTVTPSKAGGRWNDMPRRSEEHTSELQSLMRISYAVFCLKKKKNNTYRY